MSSFVWMKVLESAPERYDRGIRMLSGGHIEEVYQRIAEHFSEDGFFLKAIAIYKKINRLDPQRTETYEKLADLYFKQSLVVEGRQQLMTLADHVSLDQVQGFLFGSSLPALGVQRMAQHVWPYVYAKRKVEAALA